MYLSGTISPLGAVTVSEMPMLAKARMISGLVFFMHIRSGQCPPYTHNVGLHVNHGLHEDTKSINLIGKQSSTINSIQDASSCTIQVLGAEHLLILSSVS